MGINEDTHGLPMSITTLCQLRRPPWSEDAAQGPQGIAVVSDQDGRPCRPCPCSDRFVSVPDYIWPLMGTRYDLWVMGIYTYPTI
jgi:hypothetical protein